LKSQKINLKVYEKGLKLLRAINRPFILGLLYIACIPIFATIYSLLLTNDFYHSTIQYEYGFLSRENYELDSCLETQIIDNYYEFKRDTNKIINIDKIVVSNLTGEKNNLNFYISFPYSIIESHSNKKMTVFTSFKVTLYNIIYAGKDTKSPYYIREIECNDEGANNKTLFNLIFPDTIYPIIYSSNTKLVKTRDRIDTQIYNFEKASNGISSDINGNFWRMLYLSSMTITTVGYGDIVPITTRARLLISLEAILGIIIIGLFLNSIGNKLKKSSP
jgi:hypothetical protein